MTDPCIPYYFTANSVRPDFDKNNVIFKISVAQT